MRGSGVVGFRDGSGLKYLQVTMHQGQETLGSVVSIFAFSSHLASFVILAGISLVGRIGGCLAPAMTLVVARI